ncbi:hypothetical protein THAOC_28049, partial [Thalassiosira oceanica]
RRHPGHDRGLRPGRLEGSALRALLARRRRRQPPADEAPPVRRGGQPGEEGPHEGERARRVLLDEHRQDDGRGEDPDRHRGARWDLPPVHRGPDRALLGQVKNIINRWDDEGGTGAGRN